MDKGKKVKRNHIVVAQAYARFDTPFDMEFENECVGETSNGVDQKLAATVCQKMLKMFKVK